MRGLIDILFPGNEKPIVNLKRELVKEARTMDLAQISMQDEQARFEDKKIICDLSVAVEAIAPKRITGPFKSLYIEYATDTGAYVYFKARSNDDFQAWRKLKNKDTIEFDTIVNEAFLYYPAQAGKTLEIIVSYAGKTRPGSINAVSIPNVEANTIETKAKVNVTAVEGVIAPVLASRSCATIQNLDADPVFLGGSTVTDDAGARPGVRLAQYEIAFHKNSAALYGIKAAALTGDVSLLEEGQ